METTTESIYLRYGGAAKPTSEMDQKELAEMAEEILKRAKEKAFSRGRPIIYSKDGKIFQEWQDGHVEVVK